MKIAITGAGGFIGSHLTSYLTKQNIEYVKIPHDLGFENICETLKLHKPDCVVHLATLFIGEHNSTQIGPLIDANITFGTNLLEAMKSENIKYLINTGTSWQHFSADGEFPSSLYAATKTAFEHICRFYHSAYNISVITLKIFDTYGPQDSRAKLIPKLLTAFKPGALEFKLSPGDQKIHLLHVNDAVRAFHLASERILATPSQFQDFFLPSQESVSIRDLVEKMTQIAGRKPNITLGGLQYREREIMVPWSKGQILPGWEASIPLETGLGEVIKHVIHNP